MDSGTPSWCDHRHFAYMRLSYLGLIQRPATRVNAADLNPTVSARSEDGRASLEKALAVEHVRAAMPSWPTCRRVPAAVRFGLDLLGEGPALLRGQDAECRVTAALNSAGMGEHIPIVTPEGYIMPARFLGGTPAGMNHSDSSAAPLLSRPTSARPAEPRTHPTALGFRI